MFLGQSETETDEQLPAQTVFPSGATGAGWRAVPVQQGRAGSHARAAGNWDLSCSELVQTPETGHLRTAFKVLAP